ncbi:MAG: glucose-6-phosphate dehydrogenase [Actinomycetota bacterium]
MSYRVKLPPQAVVIFGASGDLTRRKLIPAFFHLFLEGLLPEGFALTGYALDDWSDQDFRAHAEESVKEFGRHPPEGEVWHDFLQHLTYLSGDFSDKDKFMALADHLKKVDKDHGTEGNRFFHAATPSSVFPDVVGLLGESGLAKDARIVFEKPFGHDLESAKELNRIIHEVFDESQVFRIDHYLGKETVQNILAFRFSNGMFEPVWNRRYIDSVQITVAEDIGIEGRGAFYEQTGAIRDMVQTHLFQVMTFLAMEPPVSFQPNRLRDETVKVLRATAVCDPDKVVRGQFEGYHKEKGVAADSQVETFAALELEIDNWRWADVPFFLRTGKALAQKTSEITLLFKRVPYNVFKGADVPLAKRDHLTIRIQPDEGITLAVNAKEPGPDMRLGRVRMDFDYGRTFQSELLDAYELLLIEAMEGDHTLFLREDGVERAWEVLQPVFDDPSPVVVYPKGSWGPEEADKLIAPRHWHVSNVILPEN